MERSWSVLKRLWFFSLLLMTFGMASNRAAVAQGLQLDDIARMREMLSFGGGDTTASNRFANDPLAIAFGRTAFSTPAISRDRTMSCASCHDPGRHWTDGRAVPDRGTRNTQPLWNLRGALWMGWTGSADSLWGQVARVVESNHEFDLFRGAFLRRIADTPSLHESYKQAFGPLPRILRNSPPPCETVAECHDWWTGLPPETQRVIDNAFVNAVKGIAAFVGTIRPPESRFFALAQGLTGADDRSVPPNSLSESEVRGFRTFVGKGKCTLCHHGETLSDGEFHSIRLRALSSADSNDRYAGVSALLASPFNLLGRHNDALDQINHTRFVQQDFALLGTFRTPSLVGVGKTQPYMHDGRISTLQEVVDYYSEFEGAAEPGHHENVILGPLKLTDDEKADLVAFLLTL